MNENPHGPSDLLPEAKHAKTASVINVITCTHKPPVGIIRFSTAYIIKENVALRKFRLIVNS